MKTYKKFKDNNKLYLSLLICLSLSIFNSHSQVTTTNNLGGLVEVEQIQEAFGDNANYFVIKNHMDSLVQNGFINDTLEDGPMAHYNRWDWFWRKRNTNVTDLNSAGSFSNYMQLMQQHAVTNCDNNPTNIEYNWNLLGPIQLNEQKLGRIDVIKTVPNSPNSKVLYAGAPTSGLWRTNDYTVASPIWENITDHLHLPFMGVANLEFDPNDNETAYITAGYKNWSELSIGVFKTTNLSAPQPTWTKILGGPSNSFNFQIKKIIVHPTNSNELFIIRNNDLLHSIDGGNTYNTLASFDIPGTYVNFTDFILDKNNPNVI